MTPSTVAPDRADWLPMNSPHSMGDAAMCQAVADQPLAVAPTMSIVTPGEARRLSWPVAVAYVLFS
jgi:hypothetical protein